MWRDWIRRIISMRPISAGRPAIPLDPSVELGQAFARDRLQWAEPRDDGEPGLLDRVEEAALQVYVRHGLPTQTGDYRRGPRARTWTFLGQGLSPADRWALIQDRPPEQGWRYGGLADIGREGPDDVRAAAALLKRCFHLRARLSGRAEGDAVTDMEDAIALGIAWRVLEARLGVGAGTRLRLSAPSRSKRDPAG